MKNKSRVTRTKASYQRKNLRVVFQHPYDNNGYSCKSAVAVRNAKIIYECWKTICVFQNTYELSLYSRYYMEKKLVTNKEASKIQRRSSGVAFQLSYDIGSFHKSVVAVRPKTIYRDWKATHETQQNRWTSTPLVSQMENNSRVTRTTATFQHKNIRVVCQHPYDNNDNSCKSAVAVRNVKIIYEC